MNMEEKPSTRRETFTMARFCKIERLQASQVFHHKITATFLQNTFNLELFPEITKFRSNKRVF